MRCRTFQELGQKLMNVNNIKKYILREKTISTRRMIYTVVIIWGEFGFLIVVEFVTPFILFEGFPSV